jgi:hypothetical protein
MRFSGAVDPSTSVSVRSEIDEGATFRRHYLRASAGFVMSHNIEQQVAIKAELDRISMIYHCVKSFLACPQLMVNTICTSLGCNTRWT